MTISAYYRLAKKHVLNAHIKDYIYFTTIARTIKVQQNYQGCIFTASPAEFLCLQMVALFVFSWVVDLLCIDIVPVILYRACINKQDYEPKQIYYQKLRSFNIVIIMYITLTIIVGVMTSALSKDKDPTQEQDTV